MSAGDGEGSAGPSGVRELVLSLAPGLPDEGRLAHAAAALLRPLGAPLRLCRSEGRCADALVRWSAGGAGGGLPVDLGRLRAAFEGICGAAETPAPRDRLGRVSGRDAGRDISRPHLSQWGRQLADALAALAPDAAARPRLGLTVYLTHDVDRVCPWEPMGLAGRMVRAASGLWHGGHRPARELARWVAGAPGFAGTYERLMRMERDAGAVATYYFMSGPYSLRRYGSRSGRSGRARRLLSAAAGHGHRVGLHGCAYSLRRGDYLRQREALSRLAGCEVTWHRNHYLVWDALRSPGLLARAGIRVDSTCGFHDADGFRAGLAWPYELWDLQADAPSGVLEIPLIYMDATEGLADEGVWDRLRGRLEALEGLGAEVAVLFHLDCLLSGPDLLSRYRDLLAWLRGRGAVLDGSPQPAGTPGG